MLQVTASLTATRLQASDRAPLGLTYAIADSDPYIGSVSATVSWGDGTSETTGVVAAPYGPVTLAHAYSPGVYVVKVTAQNYREPEPDVVLFQDEVTVVSTLRVASDAPPVAFGPILPRSQGFPSPDQWSFNLGRDGAVLESSLTMLFLTAQGERVHNADYGTRLGRLIFALADGDLPAQIREEAARAAAANEPRVEFVGASATRQGRTARVQAEFRSRLSNQPIVINVGFAA